MEPYGKREYHRLQAASHRKFKSEDSGLLAHKSLQFLGASPDLLVTCSCHPNGICEIKCPVSIKGQKPSCKNWSNVVEEKGTTTLSRYSLYYTQIQGQMAIVEVPYCDFLSILQEAIILKG